MSAVDTGVQKESSHRPDEGREKIDFKMITFSLGGREYGIDIMKVKEISKIDRFTYVPNGSPFLRGVYNLRGEIIPIIDFRIMFHLPLKPIEAGKAENVLILNTEDQVMGVIVDSIDKVIGVSSQRVKPAHPLFHDINVQYLKGIIEYGSSLYIVLDVDRILGIAEERQAEQPAAAAEAPAVAAGLEAPAFAPSGEEESADTLELGFIRDTLSAFRGFVVSDLNLDWVKARLGEWRDLRSSEGRGVQLAEPNEADDFLEPFYSPYTGELWGEAYAREIEELLPDVSGGTLSAWNPGCGKGYESYSFAALLDRHYHGKRIKVWANDNDLLGISMAPTLAFHEEAIPPLLAPFVVKTRNGFGFKQELKDSILFEYHDILHPNPFPEVDLVLARDILSFFNPVQQQALVQLFRSKLRVGGILFIGSNERLVDSGWREVRKGGVCGFERLADEEPSNKEQVT